MVKRICLTTYTLFNLFVCLLMVMDSSLIFSLNRLPQIIFGLIDLFTKQIFFILEYNDFRSLLNTCYRNKTISILTIAEIINEINL